MTKQKALEIIFKNGDSDGILEIDDTSLKPGVLFISPRSYIEELFKEFKKFDQLSGIYFLISDNRIYIGQSHDLSSRIKNHINLKDWWKKVIIFSTRTNDFTSSDLDYLESIFIELANKASSLQCENKNCGNLRKIRKSQMIILTNYIDECLFIFKFLHLKIFENFKNPSLPKIKFQSEAVEFLKEKNINVSKYRNYATLNQKNNLYFLNPNPHHIHERWDLLLNNTSSKELIYISIPPNTFSIYSPNNQKGLKMRQDKNYINLHINSQSFIDKDSGECFKPYIQYIFRY